MTFKSPQNVQFYNITATMDKHRLSSGNIRSLLQDKFGNIWIGNYSSGVEHVLKVLRLNIRFTYTKDDEKNIITI
ncbi:two-component regulator propeller domain-containing protein, partial [Bacteroides cellulosilyticus]